MTLKHIKLVVHNLMMIQKLKFKQMTLKNMKLVVQNLMMIQKLKFKQMTLKNMKLVVQNLMMIQKLKLRSEEHTSELQSLVKHVCRLLLEKKKK